MNARDGNVLLLDLYRVTDKVTVLSVACMHNVKSNALDDVFRAIAVYQTSSSDLFLAILAKQAQLIFLGA